MLTCPRCGSNMLNVNIMGFAAARVINAWDYYKEPIHCLMCGRNVAIRPYDGPKIYCPIWDNTLSTNNPCLFQIDQVREDNAYCKKCRLGTTQGMEGMGKIRPKSLQKVQKLGSIPA